MGNPGFNAAYKSQDDDPPKNSEDSSSTPLLKPEGEEYVANSRQRRPPETIDRDSVRERCDYDDYSEHAEKIGGSSFAQATLNGINLLSGVGLLSTPFALSEAGWLGLVILALFAFVCFCTGLVLQSCLEHRPHIRSYPDIGHEAFGRVGQYVVAAMLYCELYLVAVELLILEGDNLAHLFPQFSLQWGPLQLEPKSLFVVIATLCVLPTVWLQDLSLLSYVSFFGVAATFLVGGGVLWVGELGGVGFTRGGPLLRLGGVPAAIGLFGFCYSGHAVFPNIYSSMKRPQQFPWVLAVSFTVCTLMYGGVAILGFLMYGQDIQSQITLSLPDNQVAAKVAIWTTVVNPFTKYAITLNPLALSVQNMMPGTRHGLIVSSGIRTLLVFSTMLVALAVPFFDYVMAFIGSFLSISISVVIPCVCYVTIMGTSISHFKKCTCVIFAAFGIVAAAVGTWSAVQGIINSY